MKALILLAALCVPLFADGKPNILWIVSEDNSSHWIGCYGNSQARTPRIDALAAQGILFEHAYSNAPVCAVARATIINGAYSPTMGTQHMRSRHPIPQRYRPSVEYLRAAGYYCTNNSKTDYNFKGDDHSIWDESSGNAHYKKRPDGQPFFAVFNVEATHESSIFENAGKESPRLKPGEVDLPPYLPDLPEIRKDYARYSDRVAVMDDHVGKLLDELEELGLADDTIVIYSSDHGGVLPRGKRYLEETGVKIPTIVRIPARFRELSPFEAGQRVSEPVSFVDFAPTFLSLAGLDTPDQMQGRALLGSRRVEPDADEMEFLFADRFDELYGMRRGLTDGRWKYIRNFNPHLPNAPHSFYQFGQPGWNAVRKAWREGRLEGIHKELWEPPANSEQLYDLSSDPWEIHNLAANPTHTARLATLRQRLKDTMARANDTGLIPEPLFDSLRGDGTIADFARSDRFALGKILDLAFTATRGDPADLPALKQSLTSEDPIQRHWALIGFLAPGQHAATETDALLPLLKDEIPLIRITAAEALVALGKDEPARSTLISEVRSEMNAPTFLYLLNTLRRLDLLDRLPEGWANNRSMPDGGQDYIQRFSKAIDP